MSADFEWQFGDELPEGRSDSEEGDRRSRRWWLVWLLVLLGVAGGAFAWWRQRQRTLERVEAQVGQVAQLEIDALRDGDTELYLSLQDGSDRAWLTAQQRTYTERGGLPLPIQGLDDVQTRVGGARVVADKAEVEIVHSATLADGRPASFTAVRLYRYTDGGRWLHTPADSGTQGKSEVLAGDVVQVVVFERDADWVESLIPGLEDVASGFCEMVSCRQTLPLRLNLTGGLEDEIEAEGADELALAAPFLVGAPRDPAAGEAWETALQDLVLRRLAAREAGRPPDSRAGDLLEDRLTAWFAGKLGVSRPGVTDAANLLRDSESRSDDARWVPLRELYWLRADDPRYPLPHAQVDLLLDFLEREHGVSAVVGLLHALPSSDDMEDLLDDVLDRPWSEFELRYLGYLRERTVRQVDDLSDFGSYDLLLSCRPIRDTPSIELWGMRLGRPATTLLTAGSATGPLAFAAWSPDGSSLLLRRDTGDGAYFVLSRGSSALQPLALLPQGAAYPARLGVGGDIGWSPDGRYIVVRMADPMPDDAVIDLLTGRRVRLGGAFFGWSPDSSRLLYARSASWHWTPESEVATFYWKNADGGLAHHLGSGFDVAWSPDGLRVALITSEPALRAYHVETGESVELLGTDELHRTLGFTPTLSPAAARPFRISWSPDGERVALGATQFGTAGPEQAVTIMVRGGAPQVLHRRPGGIYDLEWSPDGRWLTAVAVSRDQITSVVSDIDGGILFEEEGALISWSPGAHYMAVARGLLPLRVLDTATGEWQAIDTPGDCWPVSWNPRAPISWQGGGVQD